jgi:hypothetical protein
MDEVEKTIDFDKAILTLEEASKQGEDIWDTAANLGAMINKSLDRKQFTLGDLACLVAKRYGQDTLGDFATSIGVRKKRLQEYRTVCRTFEKSARADILSQCPQLSYSHLRLAAHKFDTLDDSMAFLNACADSNWSVEKAELKAKEMAGQPLPPQKFIDGHIEILSIDPQTGVMTVRFIGGYCPQVDPGVRGRMTMHAAGVIETPELAGAS